MRWYAFLVILLVLPAIIVGCTTDGETMTETMTMTETETQMETGSYIDVTPAEAKELINNTPDLIIIDVPPAYANGHLPGAVNYYLDGEDTIHTLQSPSVFLSEVVHSEGYILVQNPSRRFTLYPAIPGQ